jgi:hypothetical protein
VAVLGLLSTATGAEVLALYPDDDVLLLRILVSLSLDWGVENSGRSREHPEVQGSQETHRSGLKESELKKRG